MSTNGYQNYKEQSIMTMTQGELLLALYDELSKRLKRAELSLGVPNYELFEQSIKRAEDIIAHLKDTLNYDYPVSRDLAKMYDFFTYELSRVKASRKPEILVELEPFVKELREAFSTASKNT